MHIGGRPITRGSSRASDAVFVLLGLIYVACWAMLLWWYPVGEYLDILHFSFADLPGKFHSPLLHGTGCLFIVLVLVYLASILLMYATDRISTLWKWAVLLTLASAIIINVFIYPVAAQDVFNYILNSKIAYHYGENPYLVTIQTHPSEPFVHHGFLWHAPLGYGPVWLILAGIPSLISGFRTLQATLIAFKSFNAVFLVLTALAIFFSQKDKKSRWLALFVFLGNPLVLFEGVANGHNDAMVAAFLCLALLAHKRRSWLDLPLVTLSALVKPFSAALFPLFFVASLVRDRTFRRLGLGVLVSLLCVAVTFAPFWSGGSALVGMLRGMSLYSGMNSVSLFALTRQWARIANVSVQQEFYIHYAFIVLFVFSLLSLAQRLWQDRDLERAIVDAFLLFVILVSTLYAWYLIPVFSVIALTRRRGEMAFLLCSTLLPLCSYVVAVWFWWYIRWPDPIVRQLAFAVFLTLPIIGFLCFRLIPHGRTDRESHEHQAAAVSSQKTTSPKGPRSIK